MTIAALRATAGLAVAARWLWICLLLSGGVAAQPIQLLTAGLPTPVMGDGFSGDNFGIASAIAGDVAVIGAYGDTHVSDGSPFGVSQGSVYLFERVDGNWLPLQKLLPPTIDADSDNFGASVAIVDDIVAIGAPRRSAADRFEVGSVFIYARTKDGYVLQQTLSPAEPESEQRFGASLAVWQGFLAVGVPWAGGGRVDLYRRDGGGSYVFERSVAPEPGDGVARFGQALAIENSTLLIGAPEAGGSGAVYLSRRVADAWGDAARLPLVAAAGEELGAALALADSLALVGAPGLAAGAVRILNEVQGIWSQIEVVVPPGGVDGDRFGSGLALDSGRAAIAAIAALANQGVVRMYVRGGNQLTQVASLDIAEVGPAKRFGVSISFADVGVLIGADLDRVGPNSGQGSARWFMPDAGGYAQIARLDSGDGAMYDRYGSAVAVDGNFAVVGAYLEDTLEGADAGAAHWFEKVAGVWQYGGQLRAPDAAIEDRFGIAVDIDGDRMAIGAFWDVVGENVDQGSVYIYRREGSGWVFEAKVTAADGRESDYFGFALSLDGDRLLVGARGASVPAPEQGVAYVFNRDEAGWQQQARLDLPFVGSTAYFGASVALAGDRALVGAPGATIAPGPLSAGAAFVFTLRDGTWSLAATLQAPQPQVSSGFGFAVAADSRRLLIGALQAGFASQGAGYVFLAKDLVFEAELRAANAQPGETLGVSVALRGDTALMGGSGYDLGPMFGVGTVRVFERRQGVWRETEQWFADDGSGGDGFGRAVALDGAHAIVGAPFRGVDNPLEGHAYVTVVDGVFADGFD